MLYASFVEVIYQNVEEFLLIQRCGSLLLQEVLLGQEFAIVLTHSDFLLYFRQVVARPVGRRGTKRQLQEVDDEPMEDEISFKPAEPLVEQQLQVCYSNKTQCII